MKLNAKLLTLMALMSVGAAGAAGTTAGTPITNQASATFDIPPTTPGGSVTPGSASSNTVTTYVLPKPQFDIQFNSTVGAADGGAQNTLGGTNVIDTLQPGYADIKPYTAINNGNVDLTIAIASDTDKAAGVSTANGTQTVTYYSVNPDTNNDGKLSTAELSAAA